MTDNEIIKALECWIRNFEGKATDYMTLCYAFDLINRQQAEIEKQERKTDVVIENYQNLCDRYIEAGAEAIKEFAERLKAHAIQKFDWNEYIDIDELDNLVKEMVGEDK